MNNTVHDTKPQVRRPKDRRAKDNSREVAQPGVLGATDPVLAAGPAAVPQLEVGELALLRVGGEGGEPVPVEVGEPQLRSGVRALLADDDPHPRRPALQLQQAGDVRDPGALADLPVAVIGRRPAVRGHFQDRGLHLLGDRHADGVVQTPGLRGQPFQELVRAAAGVGPDQRLAAQGRGSCASASRAVSMWSAAVFDPAFPGRRSRASGSPLPPSP